VTLVGEPRTLGPLSRAHHDGPVEAAGDGCPWDLAHPSIRWRGGMRTGANAGAERHPLTGRPPTADRPATHR